MANTIFQPITNFRSEDSVYSLLPLRFDRFDTRRYLLTNEAGEYAMLGEQDFSNLVRHQLDPSSNTYAELRAKHFLTDRNGSANLDALASKIRTKRSFMDGFTKLHIFVTTLRCNFSCGYCQVSRQGQFATGHYDMPIDVLHRSVELMLTSPSPTVTMEFQGGEPLLNFDLIREGVHYAKARNQTVGKKIDYVICTNLSTLTDEHLEFCKAEGVTLSTSVDGPAFLHDRNRPCSSGSGHAEIERNIRRAQDALGKQAVSALMTTTKESLKYPDEIVDEYLRLDLGSIFVRALNPYGYAVKTANAIGYTPEEFVFFYKRILERTISINRSGKTFSEAYATLILTKMLTPWPVGFVDLQSPTGSGFGVAVYNYDGDVYASDESRMLAEMGDFSFRLGNVLENSYEEIFFGEAMQALGAAGISESLAGCCDCVYQPYCGADPVRHHATQRDIFGHRPTSTFCIKNKAIIRHLFELLDGADPQLEEIFWAWINRSSVFETALPKMEFA